MLPAANGVTAQGHQQDRQEPRAPTQAKRIDLDEVTIASAAGQGFRVELNGERLYVLPGTADESLRAGDTVTIEGTVLAMPSDMARQIGDDLRDRDVYVFATTVTKR